MATLTLRAEEMLQWLPPYWHEYEEIKCLMKAEGSEIDALESSKEHILRDSFILTMDEHRIREWEKWLGLPPTGTLDERRLAILSYFAVISKMTAESIQVLVANLYKGARSFVTFEDSTIKITIKPLPEFSSEEIDFEPLLKQLRKRKPCHIALYTDRWIGTWGEVLLGFKSWAEVKEKCKTWREVYLYIRE